MLDPVIKAFLQAKMHRWIRKNTKPTMGEKKKASVTEEGEKLYEFNAWINRAVDSEKAGDLTTHPAKFTNSSIRNVSPLIPEVHYENDGFLRFGNVKDIEIDCVVNAADIPKGNILQELNMFLLLRLKDGKRVIEHIQESTDCAIDLFKGCSKTFKEIREEFILIGKVDTSTHLSHGKLKQVYFPVEEEATGYHLLSILTSSGMMYELKQRINQIRFSEEAKQAREDRKSGEYNADGVREIYDFWWY